MDVRQVRKMLQHYLTKMWLTLSLSTPPIALKFLIRFQSSKIVNFISVFATLVVVSVEAQIL